MKFNSSIFQYIKDIYTEQLPYFPSNIRASLLILLFCVVAILELYLYILYRRISQANRLRKQKKWSEYIGNMLANLIVYDSSDEVDEIIDHFYGKFKKLPLRNHIVQQTLIREITTYHKNFIGKPLQVLEELYLKLHLDEVSRKKIKNKNWEVKIEGIREANEMRITDVADDIIGYTDDENGYLRMEAQAAYLRLSLKDPFHFLDRARERILEWHQLVLFEKITKNKQLQIPSFSKWLRSPNDTVVLLCLKLIDHFTQFDAESEVERLLQHHNPEVVKKSIQIIGKLEFSNAEKSMFEIYFDHKDDIKVEILNALGNISSSNYNEFLSSRIYSTNMKLKRAALYAIKRSQGLGDKSLKEMFLQTTSENQSLIKHVLDNRIKE